VRRRKDFNTAVAIVAVVGRLMDRPCDHHAVSGTVSAGDFLGGPYMIFLAELAGTAEVFVVRQMTVDAGFRLLNVVPGAAELIGIYQERTGRAVDRLDWYQVLALWKAAVFCEAIFGRWARGERPSDDPFAA
jgi:hypothetical protein